MQFLTDDFDGLRSLSIEKIPVRVRLYTKSEPSNRGQCIGSVIHPGYLT